MQGFALLEILIALTLISLAIVNLLQQQINIYQTLQNISYYTLAINQVMSIRVRYQINEDPAYRLTEMRQWQSENAQLLPKGESHISCSGNKCQVNMQWQYKIKHYLNCNLSL